MQGIVNDNVQYAKVVLLCGFRNKFRASDMSTIFEDETVETSLKEAAEVSMGTEISDIDIDNIQALAEQVLSMTEYRVQLFEYLKNRMNAIAPNLTILVGELVGARLISHAGSLMNLAKQPASTVQILGAEKALFRALKTKHDTPKYGLIYHASLIGQAPPKHKGKISRVLAAKTSLATRVDALSDETAEQVDTSIGFEGRAKVEARLRQLENESNGVTTINKNGGLTVKNTKSYTPVEVKPAYNETSDMVLGASTETDGGMEKTPKDKKKKSKKRKLEDGEKDKKSAKKKSKKSKKEKKESKDNV